MPNMKPEDGFREQANERRSERNEAVSSEYSTPEVRSPEPALAAVTTPFDVRLVPEFDGTTDVVEWFTRAALLCEMRGVNLMSVIPLRLAKGAFAVWSQLPAQDRCSLIAVRTALFSAFALDQFAAYEAFSGRRLHPGESPDVYLAELRRLAALFGGVSDQTLVCAFVSGLPDSVRQTIRAGSRAEGLDLNSTLTRVRAVLSDDRGVHMAAAAEVHVEPTVRRYNPRGQKRLRRCWTCGSPEHIAPQCPAKVDKSSGNEVGDVA